MEPTESNAARIIGRFLFISGCSAHFGGDTFHGFSVLMTFIIEVLMPFVVNAIVVEARLDFDGPELPFGR